MTADSAPAKEPYQVRWASRRWPIGVRHALVALLIARRAAVCDVVYATGMPTRAALGAALAGRPLVVKITSDTTYERAVRRGWFDGDLAEFQRSGGGLRVGAVVRGRRLWLSRAAHVFCPSAFLRELAIGWGLPPERVSVIPNPAPVVAGLPPREELRAAFGMDGPTLAFGGRLGPQKALGVALEALAGLDGVTLLLAGDGPERALLDESVRSLGLEQRARFLGPQPRERVLELFHAADASLLSSAWENFPHGVVESLAVGTPVISTDVGGIAEVLHDGENGLLVPSGDSEALAGAIRRFFSDEGLRRRLSEAAAPSVAEYAPDRLLARIEEELARAAGGRARRKEAAVPEEIRRGPASNGSGEGAKARVLMVGRTRYRLPLSPSLERKFAALRRRFDLRVLASAAVPGTDGDASFALVPPLPVRPLDGPAFHLSLPFRVAGELRRFQPDAVIAQSPYEALAVLAGRRLAGSRAKLVVELHGDWRTFPRLYGSPARRALAPVTDRLAPFALRHADAVRTLSPFTTRLAREVGVEPAAAFTAFTDLDAFSAEPPGPLPERPAALFVGVLEPYKNVDGIAAAWRLAAPRVPEARLLLVGDGHRRDVVQRLVAELPVQTSWRASLSTDEVARALDESWALLLPSRSEGTPRIVLEALCRGRAVIGSRVGGLPDVVEDGQNGILVEPGDVAGIADALVCLLSDQSLAERMGKCSRARAARWYFSAEEYAGRLADLVETAVARDPR